MEDEEENELGTLTDVLATGANDVYVVEQNGKEVLIPAIRQCILDVDLEKKRMKVQVSAGGIIMNYHVLTLFPEMIERSGLNASIIGRAIKKELITLEAVNIRDYAEKKTPQGAGR